MVVYIAVIDHRAIYISIMNYGPVNIYYGSIITETTTIPATAAITVAAVTESIIYSSVKTHVRAPVACVEAINASGKPPVTRCPI
jgi:hypothetical protein